MNIKGSIGMKLDSGQVVLTKTGAETTPFPKVDVASNRKAQNTIKRVDNWLLDNAVLESKRNNDEFVHFQFSNMYRDKLSQSDKDSLEEYLFGN